LQTSTSQTWQFDPGDVVRGVLPWVQFASQLKQHESFVVFSSILTGLEAAAAAAPAARS
jgi:hypothetical protein